MISRLLPVLAASILTAHHPLQSTEPARGTVLYVGIVPRTARITLRPLGRFSILEDKNGKSHGLQSRQTYPVTAPRRSQIAFGPYVFRGSIRLIPKDAQDSMMVGARKYHGKLRIRPNGDGTFSVISELDLEEYLYGVVPAEMSPDWPLEALKAQAVVARTFAMKNLGKFRASGFDLSGDSRSQVYGDPDRASPRVIEAVRSTRGEVLSWRGEILPAYFHSCCGGHTAGIQAVWGGHGKPPKPLRGVSDRWCKPSRDYEWTAYFSSDDILAELARHGYSLTKLKSIRPGRRDSSGFLQTVRLKTDQGTIEMRASDFRDWVGNTEIKSTKIMRIAKKSRGYLFAGRGFGHGAGLCQWGAYFMSKKNKSYKKILAYYFPGAKLAKLDE